MHAAILGLISCTGTWIAWRRHPLYSARFSFRILGEALLLLGACGCLIAGTVYITDSQSVAVQFSCLAAVVILVTLVMILLLATVATPKAAQLHTLLPPTVPVLNLYRRGLRPWLEATAVFALVCGLLCLFPGFVRYLVESVLASGLLMASIMLPTAYVVARKLDRAATALQLHPWMHWHYPPEQWQSWSAVRVSRLAAEPGSFAPQRDWRRMSAVSIGVVASALLVTPGGFAARLACAVACLAMLMGWVEFGHWDARRAPQKLQKQLLTAAPDSYFGSDGMICDGRFCAWLGVDSYLTSVSLDEREPRSVLMRFEKIMPNAYGAAQVLTLSESVLIPTGCDSSDLSLLRTALRARCPTANIAL